MRTERGVKSLATLLLAAVLCACSVLPESPGPATPAPPPRPPSSADELVAYLARLRDLDETGLTLEATRQREFIKLQPGDDAVLGFVASTGDRDLLTVETSRGAEQTISTAKYEVTGRGGKGRELMQRGRFERVVPTTPELPPQ